MYDLDNQEVAIRVLVALLLGGILGFERELKDKPSGLRTHALVAEGSAIFAIVSILVGQELHRDGVSLYDPSRIMSTVVQGVGFLVAGVIIGRGAQIYGLTTAADLWVTAAVGLAVGAGFYFLAATGVIATVVVLLGLEWVQVKFLNQFVENRRPAEPPSANP